MLHVSVIFCPSTGIYIHLNQGGHLLIYIYIYVRPHVYYGCLYSVALRVLMSYILLSCY